ncbi:parallel beta-helix domain-containing protein [Peijinzhouia sedimentorum]
MKNTFKSSLTALIAIILFSACSEKQEEKSLIIMPSIESSAEIQRALIMAEPGDTIQLGEGTFDFTNVLSFDSEFGITFLGAGIDKTILSFANQTDGAEGLNFRGNNITIQDMTVQDSKGDAIKVHDSDTVILRNIKVTWTRGPHEENGAYGLYPVMSKNILMEGCQAYNASDAGIYVGQSVGVIIRNNHAENNVAGIEIENSDDVEVYENVATGNTGGLMIFDLPDIPKKNGRRIRAYRNKVFANNHPNFGMEGNTVAMIPSGVGFMIMAYREVEVFDNEIGDNQTINACVISYLITGLPINDMDYNPFSSQISFYNNKFVNTQAPNPDLSKEMGQLIAGVFGNNIPDIAFDGFVEPGQEGSICIKDNGDATIANMDAPNEFQNMRMNPMEVICDNPPITFQNPAQIQ